MNRQPTKDVEALIESCLPLVKYFARRLVPQNALLDFDDAVSEGLVGLVQAAHVYQPERGVSFATFASIRIRGAIIDALRKATPVSRHTQARLRAVDRARSELVEALGREPDDAELAAHLHVDAEGLRAMQQGSPVRLVSLDELSNDEDHRMLDDRSTEDVAIVRAQVAQLGGLLEYLPRREEEIVRRRYVHGETMESIARDLGISTSRACQIHRRALERLRAMLEGMKPVPGRAA